jgi:hypothetical protein
MHLPRQTADFCVIFKDIDELNQVVQPPTVMEIEKSKSGSVNDSAEKQSPSNKSFKSPRQ